MKHHHFIGWAILAIIIAVAYGVFAQTNTFLAPIDRVKSIAWDETHSTLFILNRDDTVSAYDFVKNDFIFLRKSFPGTTDSFVIAATSDGSKLAFFSGATANTRKLSVFWIEDIIEKESPTPAVSYLFGPLIDGVMTKKLSDDGKKIFVTYGKNDLYFLDTEKLNQKRITLPGDKPVDLAMDGAGRLLIINGGSEDLNIVDVTSQKVITTVKLGSDPLEVLFNTVTGLAYISHAGSDDVYVVDTAKAKVVRKIPVGNDPMGLAYDNKTGEVFVANNSSGTLNIVSKDFSVRTIDLKSPAYFWSAPLFLSYLNNYKKLFILNSTEAKLFVYDVDQSKIAKEEKIDISPKEILSSEKSGMVFVRHHDANSILVMNARSFNSWRIPQTARESELFLSYPQSVIADNDSNIIFVSNMGDDTVTVIDGTTQKPIRKIKVNPSPQNLFINLKAKKLYAVSPSDKSVAIVDIQSQDYPTKIVKLDGQVRGGALNSRTNKFYVSNTSKPSLDVMDMTTEEIVSSIPLPAGSFPLLSSIDEERNKIYTALYGTGSMAVIDGETNKIEKQITVGQNPIWTRYISVLDRIFVTAEEGKSVAVIDPKTQEIIQSISISGTPYRIYFDLRTDYVYISHRRESKVTVLAQDKTSSQFKIIKEVDMPFWGETGTGRYQMVWLNDKTNLAYFTSGIGNSVVVVKNELDEEGIRRAEWYATIMADGKVIYSLEAEKKAEEAAKKQSAITPTIKVGILGAIILILASAVALFIRKRRAEASPPSNF